MDSMDRMPLVSAPLYQPKNLRTRIRPNKPYGSCTMGYEPKRGRLQYVKEKKVVKKAKRVFFLICRQSHWFLMVATVKTRKVQEHILNDSLEIQTKWRFQIVTGLPQQPDLSSCGIFTLINMKQVANGYKLIHVSSQSEVELARKCIAAEILLGKLAEPSDYPLFLKERNSSSAHHRVATGGSCWKYFFCGELTTNQPVQINLQAIIKNPSHHFGY
ncbi:hypothetical protein ACFE04_002557 [Oxalis oulophora]